MTNKHPRKISLFIVIVIAAVALTQSGQHGQISGYIANLFDER